jgi:hypothetical protein
LKLPATSYGESPIVKENVYYLCARYSIQRLT